MPSEGEKEREAEAARRILDRTGIRAEWASVKDQFSVPSGLGRGVWYRILSLNPQTNMVGIEKDDQEIEVHFDYLMFRADVPTKATVFSPSTFQRREPGKPTPLMTYMAVCPKGHDMGEVQLVAGHWLRPRCDRDYELEHEGR